MEVPGPEIFLWAHKVKDGEGKESPHYVPLLPCPRKEVGDRPACGASSCQFVLARTDTRRVSTWRSNCT